MTPRPFPATLRAGLILAAVLGLTLAAAPGRCFASTIDIVAPADLRAPLAALKSVFERSHPGQRASLRPLTPSAMNRETDGRLNSDILVLSDLEEMRSLVRRGLVDSASVRVFATDRIALVAPAFQRLGTLQELAGDSVRHIAIVNPSRGSAGMLAVLALNRAGVWAGVQPKIVHGNSAGEVISQMEAGRVQAGLVYVTDTVGRPGVRIVGTFERPYADPVRHVVGVVTRSRHAGEARAYSDFLASGEAQALLRTMGFRTD